MESIKLKKNGALNRSDLEALCDKLRSVSDEATTIFTEHDDTSFTCVISGEKFFFRTSSMAGSCVYLTQSDGICEAYVVSLGAGIDLWNVSFGATAKYKKELVEILNEFGFAESRP